MGVLSGVFVVSLEQAVAAPFATRLLADQGARVVKIERCKVGDFARAYDSSVLGMSSYFVWLNRSKESLTLNLATDAGRGILRKVLERADILVENLAPGSASRLGVDYESLCGEHPSLIVCDISGYGLDGPYGGRRAYDLLIQCETGLVAVTGTDEQPSRVGISIADIAAGMSAYSGILAALYRRSRTGEGGHGEVTLLDALAEWMSQPAYYDRYGGQTVPRTGARHPSIAPYGPFECGDGKVVFIAVQNEREWSRFSTAVLDRGDLIGDTRFRGNEVRVAHIDELNAIVRTAFLATRSDRIVELLDGAQIAYSRLRSAAELWNHPQLRARRRIVQVDTPGGMIEAILPPVSLNGERCRIDRVPSLGEHTSSILRELGYAGEVIDSLRRTSVI